MLAQGASIAFLGFCQNLAYDQELARWDVQVRAVRVDLINLPIRPVQTWEQHERVAHELGLVA